MYIESLGMNFEKLAFFSCMSTNDPLILNLVLWNNFSLRSKNSQTIDEFKFELKKFWKIDCFCSVSSMNDLSIVFI